MNIDIIYGPLDDLNVAVCMGGSEAANVVTRRSITVVLVPLDEGIILYLD